MQEVDAIGSDEKVPPFDRSSIQRRMPESGKRGGKEEWHMLFVNNVLDIFFNVKH